MPANATRLFVFLLFALGTFCAPVQADLVWRPDTGWQIEGGILDTGEDSDTPTTALSLMNEARVLAEEGKERAALRRYRRVFRQYEQSIYAPEALFQTALLRVERKQWRQAMSALQQIVENYPEFPKFNELIALQFQIAEALQKGARLRIAGTVPGFRSKSTSIEFYETVIRTGPFSEFAPKALSRIAEIELSRNNPEDAIDAFDRLINEYPRNALAPESYLGLAEAFALLVMGPEYDQGSTRQAIAFYEDFLILFPRHERVEEAEEGLAEMREMLARSRLLIGDFYKFRRRNHPAARILYNETITTAPNSPSAEIARRRLANLRE